MPLAAHATWSGGTLNIEALLGHPDRPGLLKTSASAQPGNDEQADALGLQVAQQLIDQGARDWLAGA